MRVEETALPGVVLIHGATQVDVRGRSRKVLTVSEARGAGVEIVVDQVLTVENRERGTVRGLHFQVPPREESKTLWVTRGSVFDVLLDVRQDEPTYGTWIAFDVHAQEDVAIHVPAGVAHGYQTLEPHSSLTYLIGGSYSPPHSRTVLWNDSTLGITWPLDVTRLSENDRRGSPWPLP